MKVHDSTCKQKVLEKKNPTVPLNLLPELKVVEILVSKGSYVECLYESVTQDGHYRSSIISILIEKNCPL